MKQDKCRILKIAGESSIKGIGRGFAMMMMMMMMMIGKHPVRETSVEHGEGEDLKAETLTVYYDKDPIVA